MRIFINSFFFSKREGFVMNIRLSIESSDNLDWLFILNQFDDGGKFELRASTILIIQLKVIITTAPYNE